MTERRDTLDRLEADIDTVKSEDAILVIGSDINAAIGTNVEAGMDEHDSQSSSPVGPCGVHHLNDRSGHGVFLEWLLKMGLCSIGTFFQKPSHATWQSPNDDINPTEGGFMNDHIMAPKAELRRFEGLKYFEGTESDHTAVHVRIRTAGKLPRGRLVRQRRKSKQTKKSRQVLEPKVDWERILMVDGFKLEFCEKFNLAMAELGEDPAYSEIVEIMLEVGRDTAILTNRSSRAHWFDLSYGTLVPLIRERNRAQKVDRPNECSLVVCWQT